MEDKVRSWRDQGASPRSRLEADSSYRANFSELRPRHCNCSLEVPRRSHRSEFIGGFMALHSAKTSIYKCRRAAR